MAQGDRKCASIFINVLNVIFLIVGLFMLGAGVYFRVKGIFLSGFIFGVNVSIGLMVLGGIIIFISMFGIIAVFSATKCLLYTYAFMVALTIVGELVLGSFAFVERSKMYENLLNAYNNDMSQSLQAYIREQYNCKNGPECAEAMSVSFKEYTLIIGIISFCMIAVSLIILMITWRMARGSKKVRTETIIPAKKGGRPTNPEGSMKNVASP